MDREVSVLNQDELLEDDGVTNRSGNRPFHDVLAKTLSRRTVVKGGLTAAAAGDHDLHLDTELSGEIAQRGHDAAQQIGQLVQVDQPGDPGFLEDRQLLQPRIEVSEKPPDLIAVPAGHPAYLDQVIGNEVA